MYTEEQARKLWCPEARIKASVNRFSGEVGNDVYPDLCRCMASGCMMWRWHESDLEYARMVEDAPIDVKIVRAGFCGLAGRP